MAMLQRMLNCNTYLISSVSSRLCLCNTRFATRSVAAAVSRGTSSSSRALSSVPCLSRHRRSQHLHRLQAAAAADVEQLEADGAGYATHALEGPMSWPSRSHGAGDVTEADVGREVTVCGWVDRNRNLGGLGFMDIRDHTGLLQVVFEPQSHPDASKLGSRLRSEWVVSVKGQLRLRKDPNKKIKTGAYELLASEVIVLNTVSKPLPFPISSSEEGQEAREEVRLKHRVLDLRRPPMAANLRLRHRLLRSMRRFLEDDHGFIEVETPMLTRSTPEGARDYLVPSRLQAGDFYALPQSPQLFKQMLMVAGYDRYYQVARCFRDEDLRADRQPEFTQLDMELAFTDREGIMALMEGLIATAFRDTLGVEISLPLPRLPYAEAMAKYGSDKPDLRYGLEFVDVSAAVAGCGCRVFESALSSGGVVKAIRVPEGKRISNSRLKPPKGDVVAEAIAAGAAGLVFMRVLAGGSIDAAKPVKEGLYEQQLADLLAATQAQEGDLLLFAAGPASTTNKALDRVRQFLAKELKLIDPSAHNLLWVTDFPMFEWNEDEQRLEALHHPFTAPNPEDLGSGDLRHARALAYDMVYNGVEIGGGSLRIYRRDVQQQVFDTIGLTREEAEAKFGYLLECFELGAPPHGGIAFGLDRLAMLLAGSAGSSQPPQRPPTAFTKAADTSLPPLVSSAGRLTGGACRASGEHTNCTPSQVPQRLFDGSLGTKWLDFGGGGAGGSAWVEYRLLPSQDAVTITHYDVIAGEDCPERDPCDWVLEAAAPSSNNSGSSSSGTGSSGEVRWVALHECRGHRFSRRQQLCSFTVPAEAQLASRQWRLKITRTADPSTASCVQLACWNLYHTGQQSLQRQLLYLDDSMCAQLAAAAAGASGSNGDGEQSSLSSSGASGDAAAQQQEGLATLRRILANVAQPAADPKFFKVSAKAGKLQQLLAQPLLAASLFAAGFRPVLQPATATEPQGQVALMADDSSSSTVRVAAAELLKLLSPGSGADGTSMVATS